jgi:phosphatidate cytidylyltransferase
MLVSRDAWLIFAVVVGVLTLASAIGALLARGTRDTAAQPVIDNLNARIRAWWVMVLALSGALMAGHMAVLGLFLFVSVAALREFVAIAPCREADHLALITSFAIVLPMQYVLIWAGWYGMFALFVPMYACVMVPLFQFAIREDTPLLTIGSTLQSGIILAVWSISHLPALLMLSISGRDPALLLVFSIVVVQASDILQYVFGKLFGRHAIAPVTSPSKTIEGFAGGILGATLLGSSLWWMTPFTRAEAGVISMLLALMGFLGGLMMSAIKRHRGVKDWGRLVSGHGGILDRLDSHCLAAPLFFYLMRHFSALSS